MKTSKIFLRQMGRPTSTLITSGGSYTPLTLGYYLSLLSEGFWGCTRGEGREGGNRLASFCGCGLLAQTCCVFLHLAKSTIFYLSLISINQTRSLVRVRRHQSTTTRFVIHHSRSICNPAARLPSVGWQASQRGTLAGFSESKDVLYVQVDPCMANWRSAENYWNGGGSNNAVPRLDWI